MLVRPMDILTHFPVRRSKIQKQKFRDEVQAYLERQDYIVTVEEGLFGSKNLVIGDPEKAKYVVTAHYDTCAALPFPNLLTPFNPGLFVLYQFLIAILTLLPALLLGILAVIGVVLFAQGDMVQILDYAYIAFMGIYLPVAIGNLSFLYFGPANRNNANDNTSGVITLLEIARTLPENRRQKVCFVLFDLEEKGLWGSKSYRKAHKEATDRQLIINLDCVGDGDYIRMFPTKKLKQDRKKLTSLYKACGYVGKKSILVHEKGVGINPSDHRNFPYGIGVCALRKNKLCYYLGRIHTKKDTVLDEENVNILRAALTSFICCDS